MGQNNPYRSTSDNGQNNHDHERASGAGKSGGNAGAGKSGKEGLGIEKRSREERFGSQKPDASPMNKPD